MIVARFPRPRHGLMTLARRRHILGAERLTYTVGPVVLAVQKKLLADGVHLPKYGADGHYGEETATGIKFWRKAHGWDEGDGKIDEQLLSDMGLPPYRAGQGDVSPRGPAPSNPATPDVLSSDGGRPWWHYALIAVGVGAVAIGGAAAIGVIP